MVGHEVSIINLYVIKCDKEGCLRETDIIGMTPAEARELAADDGFTRDRSLDLCPEHSMEEA